MVSEEDCGELEELEGGGAAVDGSSVGKPGI